MDRKPEERRIVAVTFPSDGPPVIILDNGDTLGHATDLEASASVFEPMYVKATFVVVPGKDGDK
jgi:hypothetical protein